jgi:hypothetical protein
VRDVYRVTHSLTNASHPVSPACFLIIYQLLTITRAFASSISLTDPDIHSSTTIPPTELTTTQIHHITALHPPPTQFTPTQLTFTPSSPVPTPWQTNPANRRRHVNPAAIFLAIFGSVVGFGLFLGLTRCLYNYSKTPPRDRISGVMNRYQLQRELEELERNPFALRRTSLREPAPPYIPKPPSYTERPSSPRVPGLEYAEVHSGSPSPPGSPIASRGSLEAHPAAPTNSSPFE